MFRCAKGPHLVLARCKRRRPQARSAARTDRRRARLLGEQGDLIVEATGVRQGYGRLENRRVGPRSRRRWQSVSSNGKGTILLRVQSVVTLAQHEGCVTSHLLEYFGETRPDCGHCARCHGEPAKPLAATGAKSRAVLDAGVIRHFAGPAPRGTRIAATVGPISVWHQLARNHQGQASHPSGVWPMEPRAVRRRACARLQAGKQQSGLSQHFEYDDQGRDGRNRQHGGAGVRSIDTAGRVSRQHEPNQHGRHQ